MRLRHVILCLLLTHSVCLAGTNDLWQVMMRACDSNGTYTQFNSEFGTKTGAVDGFDLSDESTGAVNRYCAWIACYDLGPGNGNGYCKDYRAPVTTVTTWNLKLRVGYSWASPSVCLRLWNPAGAMDINGTIPISLKVTADPTGTYSAGQVLISTWDPDLNGTQIEPAYTITFGNAAALLGGSAIELQLIAGAASEIVCTIGEARGVYASQRVRVSGVTAASGDADLCGTWVTSDGLPGLRVGASLGIARGEMVDLSGIVTWTDGVPLLTGAQLKTRHDPAGPGLHVMPCSALANDRRETLTYAGINPVGLPGVICGEVTARDAILGVFYVDDGSGLTDGLGPSIDPYRGIRVVCAPSVTLPDLHSQVRVTGIRSVEKHVLAQSAWVNGELRQAGETLYVPVILIRDADDFFAVL